MPGTTFRKHMTRHIKHLQTSMGKIESKHLKATIRKMEKDRKKGIVGAESSLLRESIRGMRKRRKRR